MGGMEEKRNIHWVSWKVVMLPYLKGGLAIKDISDFNLALLNKWRWRMVQGHKSLWLDVLKVWYGDVCMHVFCGGVSNKPSSSSSSSSFWVRDILKVGVFLPSSIDPLVSNFRFKVENDFNTPFRKALWLGDSSLMEVFPELFLVSSVKKVSIAAMGGWCDGV